MLWLKSFHLIAMVAWFAGLFYLPRLFVYHAMAEDATSRGYFATMEHKLLWRIMNPAALLTVLTGVWMLILGWSVYIQQLWIFIKLFLVLLLLLYHVYCGVLLKQFAALKNTRSHVWYRWFNEAPTVFLVLIVLLAVIKPW